MNRFFTLGILLFSIKLLLLEALPIDDYKELECSAQDKAPSSRTKRSAKSLSKYPIWPDSKVHYVIDCPNFTNEELAMIRAALDEIEAKTCVKFIHIKGLGKIDNFLRVQCKPDGGCKAELGYQGRPQILNLQVHREKSNPGRGGCITIRKIQHEFLHALGFRHEHNAPSRDKYVKIMRNNIANGWDHYFDLDNPKEFDNYGCIYDYHSIMQVDGYRHSKSDKLATIIPLDKNFTPDTLGKAKSISACDVTRIRNMYCKEPNKKMSKPQNLRKPTRG